MRVTSNKSILTNLNELIKAEIEKLKVVRYEKTEDGRYRAIQRDPKVDLTINEVTQHIINLTRGE